MKVTADSDSSYDPRHPPNNAVDGKKGTFWMTTGMYPQTLDLKMDEPTTVSKLTLSVAGAKTVSVTAFDGTPLSKTEFAQPDSSGSPVMEESLSWNGATTTVVRVTIEDGWHPFASVHTVQLA